MYGGVFIFTIGENMKKLLLLFVSLSLLALYSCGKNEQKPVEKKDVTTEVKTDNKTLEQKTDGKQDEKKSGDNELGLKTGLPADFPKDVPQPPNSKCVGSIVNQTEGTTVTFSSTSKVMEIAAFYKEEMKKTSYQLEQGMEDLVKDNGGMLKWNKPGKEVELLMSFNSEQKATDIVLSYKDKK